MSQQFKIDQLTAGRPLDIITLCWTESQTFHNQEGMAGLYERFLVQWSPSKSETPENRKPLKIERCCQSPISVLFKLPL